MDSQTAIIQLQSLVGQKQNEIDAINAAILVLTNGYQSDQDIITKGIQEYKDKITTALI